MISQINCFVLNASLKMSNVILGIASLSPVLLVLCYICNKCLLVGERRMEFISPERVCLGVKGTGRAEKGTGTGSFPSPGALLARNGREDEFLTI